MFFGILAAILVALLLVASLIIVIPGFINETRNFPDMSFNQPSVIINLDILDSNKTKKLELFSAIETTFNYVVTDKNNRQITGTIVANTKDQAQKMLEDSGFKVLSLQGVTVGRPEPFVFYNSK